MEHRFSNIQTPAHVVVLENLRSNLEKIKYISRETGCKIYMTQKAFSVHQLYDYFKPYLFGMTAASLYEARLAKEHGFEVFTYSPAYNLRDFSSISSQSDYIVFNSISQAKTFHHECKDKQLGLRINPNIFSKNNTFVNPCRDGSHFGVLADEFHTHRDYIHKTFSGLMFHCLFRDDLTNLKRTLETVENQFSDFLQNPMCKFISFGGGIQLTSPSFDLKGIISVINSIQQKYQVQVILEPGECLFANGAGLFVTTIQDIVHTSNGYTAILDCSPFAQLDFMNFSLAPIVHGAEFNGTGQYLYTLAGCSCLSGDQLGTGQYSFNSELHPGDQLIIEGQLAYSIGASSNFCGLQLPDIVLIDENNTHRLIYRNSYQKFKESL
ncbi:MAG: hypothetical protein E7286_07520 [Lachnospiraceae bacterium]|nr:hypothetical protein [Lachnospiraceae bacterium]